MEKLHWYIVDKKYIEYLKNFDDKIQNVDYKLNLKPFIGIVIKINNFDYYVPISSPKPKHYKMKDGIDFIRVKHQNRILGVLNLNNMIPILDKYVTILKYKEIEKYRFFKSEEQKNLYISLLNIELKCINLKYEEIKRKAMKLYLERLNNKNSRISQRCCDFKFLESKLNQFILNQEKSE